MVVIDVALTCNCEKRTAALEVAIESPFRGFDASLRLAEIIAGLGHQVTVGHRPRRWSITARRG
jgi:hypothetical protein